MKIQIIAVAFLIAGSVVAAPLGTEFTYQGVLSDAGAPAAGVFDFRFFLYDAVAGGSQVGSVVLIEDLTVADGRITTQLDFGSVFDGTALWLEVGVRDGGLTGAYTVLSPRQELTAAPFAQHAKAAETADSATTAGHAITADSATLAGNADALDGQSGSYYLTWSNLVGVPEGLDDGDNDTLADLVCAEDEIALWNGATWMCSADDDTPFVRTFVVGPVGGPNANGTALLDALSQIPVPIYPSSAVLVKLEPGAYDLGTEALDLLPYMALEGSGRDLTSIISDHCSINLYSGTIRSVSTKSALRHLKVENYCDDPAGWSIAFSNQGSFARVENVDLTARGTALRSYAMFNSGGSTVLKDSTLTAQDSTGINRGLEDWAGARLFDVEVVAVRGETASGIHTTGGYFEFRGGKVMVLDGTSDCHALKSEGVQVMTLSDVELEAFCAGADNRGLDLEDSAVVISDSIIGAAGTAIRSQNWGTSRNIFLRHVYVSASGTGIWCQDSGTNGTRWRIQASTVAGGMDAVNNTAPECSFFIAATHLPGGVTGSAVCAGVSDDSYTFFANSCPP